MQRRLVEPLGTRAHLVGARVDSGVTLRLTQCGDQAIGAAERGAYARHGTAHGRAVDAYAEDRRQHRVRVRDRTEMQQVVTADGTARVVPHGPAAREVELDGLLEETIARAAGHQVLREVGVEVGRQ